jgi:hypothetical protein
MTYYFVGEINSLAEWLNYRNIQASSSGDNGNIIIHHNSDHFILLAKHAADRANFRDLFQSFLLICINVAGYNYLAIKTAAPLNFDRAIGVIFIMLY